MSYRKKFFVQDTRSIVGNSVTWWCTDGKGYTCDIRRAGVFDEDEVAKMRDTDKPWPVEDILRLVQHHVDCQDLRLKGDKLPMVPHTMRKDY